ncbi:dehydrogenase/reductase SDR family member on chromosome X-like isoform X2 [Crassostrea angulata]|nr:dehydrogenase/reductase SDR family member on chromosome X-like isoform X2 [Crassostrea angulata]
MALPIVGLIYIIWSAIKIYTLGFFALLRQIIQKHKAAEVKLHTGKVALVTGGTCGIGFHVSMGLVSKNVHVVMAGHSIQKGEDAITRIREEYPNAKVDFLHLDLSSLKSVQTFVAKIKARGLKVHVLVNNAGIMFAPYKETVDELESHFQVNYLSHLYLTQALIGILEDSATEDCYARVINVSSIVHNVGSLSLQSIGKRCSHCWEYSPHAAYANSKLYITLSTWYLSELFRQENQRVTVNAVHPGIVNTDLYKHVHPSIKWFLNLLAHFTYLTPSEGADTILYLALSPDVERESGWYYDNCQKHKTCQLSYSEKDIKEMFTISTDIINSKIR